MILKLTNVGRLKPTEVIIEGLTVICGNNNTGKSTIGKTLYCIFNAFHDIELNILREKEELISRYLRNRFQIQTLLLRRIVGESVDEFLQNNPNSEKEIRAFVENILKKAAIDCPRSTFQEVVSEIQKILLVDKEAVVSAFLDRCLKMEFDGCFGNVNHSQKKTKIDLMIGNDTISFFTKGAKEKLTVDHYLSLEKQIIYLDDPFVLDRYYDYYALFDYPFYGHSDSTALMIRNGKLRGGQTAIEEVIRNQKLSDIIEKINQISDGELLFEDGKLVYQHSGLKKRLALSNISTGIKTFLILKELLLNGKLEENGIMVIDEPEVHLHPEWQIKLAEVIVMLQKAYGLHIVLTTHSMDFLSALITFSKVYEVESSCNYYLTQLEKTDDSFPLAELKKMNENIQGLYASISEPFELLYQKMGMGDYD